MRTTATLPEENLEVRDRLIMGHVGLVNSLASRLAHRVPAQVEVNELISVGVIGLIDAAGRYRPGLGVPFDAFARRRIQGAMLDALRELDWAPRSVRKLRRDIDGAIARLRHELGRAPESGEIAGALNMSEREYDRALDRLRCVELASIRQGSSSVDGSDDLEMAVDPSDGPYAHIERAELRQLLAVAITELPDRERKILVLHCQEELTMAEIGEQIGVGESRVSQLRTQAIARLRTSLSAVMPKKRMQ